MAAFNSIPAALSAGAASNNGINLGGHQGPQGMTMDSFDQNLTFDDTLM